MGRSYFTYEESEAYKEGRRDEERNRRNYEHDKYSNEPADQAYFQGRKDEEREEQVRQEEKEQQEEYERQVMRRREEERLREEEEYNQYLQAQMEDQMREERKYYEAMGREQIHPDYYAPEYDVEPPLELQPDEMSPEELNAIPITEEDLFRQILEDERNETNPIE